MTRKRHSAEEIVKKLRQAGVSMDTISLQPPNDHFICSATLIVAPQDDRTWLNRV